MMRLLDALADHTDPVSLKELAQSTDCIRQPRIAS